MSKNSALGRARMTKGLVATVATGALALTGLGLGASSASATAAPHVVLSPQIGLETSAGYPSTPFFYGQNSAQPSASTVLPVDANGALVVPGGVQLLHQLPATGETATALSDFVTAGAQFTIEGSGTASFQIPLIYGAAGHFTTLRTDNDYDGTVGTQTDGWTSSHDIGVSGDAHYLAANTSAPLSTIVDDIDSYGSQELLAYGLQVTSAVTSASVLSLQDGTNEYTFQQDLTIPDASTATQQTVFVPDLGREHNGYPATEWFYGDKGASNTPTGTVAADGTLTISSGTQVLHQFPGLATAVPTTGALRSFIEQGASWTAGPTGTSSFQLPLYYEGSDNVLHFTTLFPAADQGAGLNKVQYGDQWRSSHAIPVGSGTVVTGTLAQLVSDIEAVGSRQELLAFGFEGTVGSPADIKSIQAGGVNYTFADQVTFPALATTATVDVGGIGSEDPITGYPATRPWFFGYKGAITGSATLVGGNALLGGGTQLLHQFSATTEPASLRAFIESGVNFTTTDGAASFQLPITYGPLNKFTTLHTSDDLTAGSHNVEFGNNWVSTHVIPATATTPLITANQQNVSLLQIVNAIEAQGGSQNLLAFGVEPTNGAPTTLVSIQAAGTKYTFVDDPNLTFAGVTITGHLNVGQTVTAVPTIVNPNGVSYAYQWYYNGNHKISGATASTYLIKSALRVGQVLSVRVVATKPGHVTAKASSDITTGILKGSFAPAAPVITGTVAVGKTLTATLATSPNPSTVTYKWFRNGVAIFGATAATHVVTAADAETSLQVKVVGTRKGYLQLSASSTPTALVALGTLKLGTPTLKGTAAVGKTLTATKGASTTGAKIQYIFSVTGNPMDAVQVSTLRTFKIPASLAGKTITVFTSGTKAGYVFAFSAGSTATIAVAG